MQPLYIIYFKWLGVNTSKKHKHLFAYLPQNWLLSLKCLSLPEREEALVLFQCLK